MKTDLLSLIRRHRKNPSWYLPALLLLAWSIDALISIFLTGFRTLDWAVITSILLKCLIIGLNVFFIYRLLIKEDSRWYKRTKTYAGYFIVFVYVFYNLPRMSWEMSGLLDDASYRGLWISSFISTLFPFVLYLILWWKPFQQAWGVYVSRKEQKEIRKNEKAQHVKRPLREAIWENADAVLQSIIIVIILQHFIFQLYVIPSESMVPTFLIKDRTLVTKFQSGPAIPLTKWRLPVLKEPKRGDIVVFQSPEYTYKTLSRRVFQQFIYYITLTLVDIDTDENGNPRKRFIVKRLIGEPGEKLMMVDDQVYVKRKGEDFHPLEADKKFSNTDLYTKPPAIRDRIAYLPIDAPTREMLDYWDSYRAKSDLSTLSNRLRTEWTDLSARIQAFDAADVRFLKDTIIGSMLKDGNDPQALIEEIHVRLDSLNLKPFQYADSYRYDILLLLNAIENGDGSLENYVEGALRSAAQGGKDLFEESSKKLNLIYKTEQLNRLLLFCDFIDNRVQPAGIASSEELKNAEARGKELFRYLNEFFDNRNFPVTPAGKDEYIPKRSYFLMGDNRYNSLDFRHSHEGRKLRALDADDPSSIMYFSLLHPYLLQEKYILGKAVATFWPPDRIKRD